MPSGTDRSREKVLEDTLPGVDMFLKPLCNGKDKKMMFSFVTTVSSRKRRTDMAFSCQMTLTCLHCNARIWNRSVSPFFLLCTYICGHPLVSAQDDFLVYCAPVGIVDTGEEDVEDPEMGEATSNTAPLGDAQKTDCAAACDLQELGDDQWDQFPWAADLHLESRPNANSSQMCCQTGPHASHMPLEQSAGLPVRNASISQSLEKDVSMTPVVDDSPHESISEADLPEAIMPLSHAGSEANVLPCKRNSSWLEGLVKGALQQDSYIQVCQSVSYLSCFTIQAD